MVLPLLPPPQRRPRILPRRIVNHLVERILILLLSRRNRLKKNETMIAAGILIIRAILPTVIAEGAATHTNMTMSMIIAVMIVLQIGDNDVAHMTITRILHIGVIIMKETMIGNAKDVTIDNMIITPIPETKTKKQTKKHSPSQRLLKNKGPETIYIRESAKLTVKTTKQK